MAEASDISEQRTIVWKTRIEHHLPDKFYTDPGTEVSVVCMFTDMPSAASGVPNRTVEVMTQSDFDNPLTVKNIHDVKLSLDRCKQGSSSLSSNLNTLSRDLGKLMEDKVIPDVNLRWGDRTTAAHKARWPPLFVCSSAATRRQQIGTKIVEAKTQNDFEQALSVKKIHALSLSSDECEQGSSCLSPNLDSLSHDLSKLLEDKVIPDVILSCGGRTIAAHKAILAARSQVFSAMFQSRMQESETGIVDIADVDAQVLDKFLKYVYSGRLSGVPNELLPSLYAAGDKYAVIPLIMACSERIISNLTRENCLNTLLLANVHSDPYLKNAVINFILNQMEILKSEEWVRFSVENSILSVEVFHAVVQRKCF